MEIDFARITCTLKVGGHLSDEKRVFSLLDIALRDWEYIGHFLECDGVFFKG